MSDSRSEVLRTMLTNVGSEDQRLFLDERRRLLEDHGAESPLLDQLCLLRVVMVRLSEGYARSLGEFEARLERRIGMRPGWRKSLARKVSGEYESPMPWLHPFRLAREALEAVQEELEAAVAAGETRERKPERLRQVLAEHGLALPLPSPHVAPRFLPGSARPRTDPLPVGLGVTPVDDGERV
jgi:hypothetical protein